MLHNPHNAKMMVIVNPASANWTTGKLWHNLEALFKIEKFNFDVQFTTAIGTATDLTRQALYDGYDFIISVGGDGTLNEIINGFWEKNAENNNKQINSDAVVGVISRGTGGDFIKTLGIPKDELEAIHTLSSKAIHTIDIGWIRFINHNGEKVYRYFANVADLGLGGEVVERVNRTTKAFGGFASFLWGTFATVLTYRKKDFIISIDDTEPINVKAIGVFIGNGKFFGGGMKICPEAEHDDGLLDIVIVGDMTNLELMSNFAMLYKGTHLKYHKIHLYKGTKIKITSSMKVLLDLDGEQPGQAPVEIGIIPSALKVKVSEKFLTN